MLDNPREKSYDTICKYSWKGGKIMETIGAFLGGVIDRVVAWFMALYMAAGGVLLLPVPIKITAPPVVMIVSETQYAVLWATDKRGTGALHVTADGETRTFYDSASGTIRSDDTLHVVRVDKEILDGCDSYSVQSQYALFNFGYFALKGCQTASQAYAFRGYGGGGTVRALFYTDVHGDRAGALASAAALRAQAEGAPDLVVFAGDIPDDGLLFKKSFIDGILAQAAALSGGEIPVLYARGNHESRGQWGTELRRYFPTDTGELYFTASYGPVSFTVLDTGEDKADDHPEYAGLADFAAYRARQGNWLNGLAMDTSADYEYRVCVCHDTNLAREEFYGNWYTPLRENLGVTHIFCGHGHNNSTWEREGIRHYENGTAGMGSLLTFTGGEIFAQSATASGTIRDFGKLG